MDILIVEDNEVYAQLLQDFLLSYGYDVKCLNNGKEVIAQIKQDRPKLVVLDIMMPGTDGLTLCHDIKTNPEIKNTKVVIHSAKFYVSDQEKANVSGADGYIDKSVDIEIVVQRIKSYLEKPLIINFLGVRGSIPIPSKDMSKYGGNTPCIEIDPGDNKTFVFDVVSGNRELGVKLM